ncbi:MAG: hypothetical protein HC836_15335 [Richelia sp. RM2_1_2]|nr:hypothetical protein [Richelia sp. SM2_1_7]NJM18900.1 hypothetical protein [Richelia sp. SM1_7_0]NJN09546.1 hypothetical protein [Richelia sp. RM1_1_1]NJO31000.1 hypothetical protein [Richelia sp. SL_2_1]NJO59617.1 hypothetical protein [Richelia sp. RM2_1_2]NJS16312.1 hypothetical protein [Nostocaceae cyanobacterium CSU_2_110]
MELQRKIITVELSDGTNVRVEATLIGERKLTFQTRPFSEITGAIESLTKEIAETVQKIKPDKARVRFGIDVSIESGKLTPLLVKDASTGNIEITLEWGN